MSKKLQYVKFLSSSYFKNATQTLELSVITYLVDCVVMTELTSPDAGTRVVRQILARTCFGSRPTCRDRSMHHRKV